MSSGTLSSDSHIRLLRWNAIDSAFVFLLSLFHVILWFWANHHTGVWLQVPAIDEAHDLTTASLFHRALSGIDTQGLLRTWSHGSSVHTPLVPLCSAFLMWVFEPSRIAAETVLPLSVTVWIFAVYAIVKRLYDRQTARWTTALLTSFPVFLIYSRPYVMEQPWAGVFALACLCLIASDGFRRADASLAFGVTSGLTALSRGGGFAVLAGPVVVTLVAFRGSADRRRAVHCAAALAIAIALASTWYLPNFRSFYSYVQQATYGRDALARTGSAAALSPEAATYYLRWLIAQGPGWPMLVVVVAGFLISAARRGGAQRPSRTTATLCGAFAIDFGILLVAMQRETARYFLPIMPIVALVIVRSVQGIRPAGVRGGAVALIALFGLHHVIALSITTPPVHDRFAAPYIGSIPLWDHRTYFNTLVDFYHLRTSADDFMIADIVQFLGTVPVPRDAVIAVVEPTHAFFHQNGLQLESIRQEREWRWVDVYMTQNSESVTIPDSDVLVLRGNVIGLEHQLNSFRESRTFMLGDGSVATVFIRDLARR